MSLRQILLITIFCCFFNITAFGQAKWITASNQNVDEPNTWIAYRKNVRFDKRQKSLVLKIATDTKYWFWINGDLVVFEGGLKRGPSPQDTYYDEIDVAKYLKKGDNTFAVLVWHFGKDGFSHKNSGKAGLIIDSSHKSLCSDSSWSCTIHPAYGTAIGVKPNYRLAESNILFDARKDIVDWQIKDTLFPKAIEIGDWGDEPWNRLVKRPIPFWKDFGIKEAEMKRQEGVESDSILVRLPYNMQMTPVIELNDPQGGNLIHISTDHSFAGSTENVRAQYCTKQGTQSYESFGWMNGQQIILVVPKSVTINSIKYRESGYDTHVEGVFESNNDFYNRFWGKAMRSIYVNMRDNYFDCPDRERAQWWGDVVVMMGQSFYSYSTSSNLLMRKAIMELCNWQREDGTLFSPIPAGNYKNELPIQMLASIGPYGFWHYYVNTGDIEIIKKVYQVVKRYLGIWELDETGLTVYRYGGWNWGDWGDNQDLRLITAGWHSLALDAAINMAELLGFSDDAHNYKGIKEQIKKGFNTCWNGSAYRHPDYHEKTDDRAQALAVISGIADSDKYEKIFQLFQSQFHASPYMEKYIMEALFEIGRGEYALERTQKRFAKMVDHPDYSTLFEGWDVGPKGYGGGTTNHAWSGGPLTVIYQHVCGIRPIEAGYKIFSINPNPVLREVKVSVPSVSGTIGSAFRDTDSEFYLNVSIPQGTRAVIYLPTTINENILLNGKRMPKDALKNAEEYNKKQGKTTCLLKEGNYEIIVKK